MKRLLMVLMVLISVSLALATPQGYLSLRDSQFTQEVVESIARSNALVRGPSFNFTSSPFNLPVAPERFYEDIPWEKDLTSFITAGSYTNLDSLVILTSAPQHFIVTFPDPLNPRFVRFVPRPEHWFGSELMAVSIYERYADGIHSDPYTAVLRINVTSVPDPPQFHDLPVDNIFYTDEDTPLTLNFRDFVNCIDSSPTDFDLFVTQTEVSWPYSVEVTQLPTTSGHLVTFTPRLDFYGRINFIVTAVDRVSNGFTPIEMVLVVNPDNDPPVIQSYLPASNNLLIDQNETVNFSANVFDPDPEVLTHTWVLSGIFSGLPFTTLVSTTTALDYFFNIPGVYTLVYTVNDGLATASNTWTINVSPVGPIFDPWGRTYDHSVSVTLTPPPGYEGAVIYYTTDGSTPTTSSPIYNQPITVPTLVNIENFVRIQAFYVFPGLPPSQIVSSDYRITGRVADPVFNPAGGTYYGAINVELSSPNAGASIYYTLDGSDPIPGNPNTFLYTAQISVPGLTSVTIKAIAIRTDWINSNIVVHHYNVTGVVNIVSHTMSPAAPAPGDYLTVEPGGSLNVLIQNLVMTPPTATLYYTLDSSIPGPDNPNSFIYTALTNIIISAPTWITIRAYNPDWLPSQTYSYYYDVRTRASILPFGNGTVFDPAPGYSTSGHTVAINTLTSPAGASVYYTLDGTDPVNNPALLYAGPIMITQTTTIKARAYYPGVIPSLIYSGDFFITGRVDTPIFTPTPNSYAAPIDVSMSTTLSGTTIYYTLNGADPLPSTISPDSYLYSGPVNLPAGQHHIRARAYKDNWEPSLIRDGYYSIAVLPAPTFNLPAGIYQDPILVRLAVPSVPDASIHYTLDGTDPTISSTYYDDSVGIPVPTLTTMTIKAIAWKAGWQTSAIASRTYNVTGEVAAPVFNPGGGDYPAATSVTITTGTAGATIRYTLNGTEPTLTSGLIYTAPVLISSSSTLKARAFLADYRQSAVTSSDYVIFGVVGNPVFTPGAGIYTSPTNVYISVNPPDAAIWYTLDGSIPSPTNGFLYTPGTPILVTSDTLISAIAIKTGWNSSSVQTAQYIITGRVTAPVFDPAGGQYASPQMVTLTAVPATATIIYTTDGSEPSLTNGTVYGGPIPVNNSMTIKAYAVLTNWDDSPTSLATYIINGNVSTPVFTPAGGYYNAEQTVAINVFPTDATIIYTTDGTIPSLTNGSTYIAPFAVSQYTKVRAFAYKTNWLNSSEGSAEYFFNVANPILSLASGAYPSAQTLTITSSTPGASIRYTIDGSDPSPVNGILYTGLINITTNTNLRAIAYLTGWINSAIVQAEYIINGAVSAPIFSIPSGNYFSEQTVAITAFPSDATIYYTTDGSTPSDTNGSTYMVPLTVSEITTLKAIAYRINWLPSPVATANYELFVRPLTANPGQGLYSSVQTVILSTPTLGTQVYYTTNGTDPDSATGTLYSGPITVAGTSQIRAIAYKNNWHPSTVLISDYVINIPVPTVAAPVFSLPAGVYNSTQSIGLSVSTPGATIRYTTDGTDPSATNGTDYAGPVIVSTTTQIRAYAFLAAYNDSPIVVANYVIILPVQTVATPEFNPQGGVFNNSVLVSISTSTPGATIYYTTDGSEPSDVNGQVFLSPINITATTTIKAVAYKAGWEHSLIANSSYVIFIPVETVATPLLLPPPGTFSSAQLVSIVTTTPGSIIMFTTDGTDPSLTNGNVYLNPIPLPLNSTTTIKAIAFKDGWTPSQMAAGTYIITGTVEPVVFAPLGGTYTSEISVILTCPTGDSTIRFTLDGSEPNAGSQVYTTGIALPYGSTTTIKAKAFKTNWEPSVTGQETYIITGQVTIAAPVFSIPSGTYTSAQTVSLGAVNPSDAVIHYTLDGSIPDETSPVYLAPFELPLNSSLNLKARAFKTDWIPSIVYSATYNVTGQIVLPAVLFTPAAGIYQTAQTVTLNTATIPSGSILRYTLDGSEPTELSPAYISPISLALNTNTTIKVKAYKTDWIPSVTASATYIITGQVVYNTPVFSPNPGVYQTAQTITINGVMPVDAVIRYTLDGSEPTETSPMYTSAFDLALNSSLTIKTRAFKADWTPSETHIGFYTTTGNVIVALPVFDPAPGLYTSPIAVTINSNTYPVNATLHYTLDGSDPNINSPVYSVPIPVNTGQTVNIRVRAYAPSWLPSDIYSGSYTVTGQVTLSDPVFTPAGGTYTSAQIVTLNTASTPAGASLRYTTDGSEPTETSAIYSTGIAVNSNMTIKVKAYKTDWLPSITYSATYVITGQVTLAAPVFSIPSGTYTSAQTVSLGAVNPSDAVIHYTLDGSIPDETSPVYLAPFELPLNSSLNLKVRAFKTDWIPSIVYSATYNVTGQIVLPAVLFTPAAGIYQTAQTVTLNTATIPSGSILRYTLDGSEPTEISPAYVNPISLALNTNTTIKVKAYKTDWIPSVTASATYIITGQVVYNTPVFSPNPGVYQTAQTITINGVMPVDAVIRYTLDGSEPTETSPMYTSAFDLALNSSLTIKTRAFKANWTPSETHIGFYTTTGNVIVALPVFDPAPGLYTSPIAVTINSNTYPVNATLHYTLDGSDPNINSPVYSVPIPVNTGQTVNIRVRAYAPSWLPSDIYNGSYTVTGQVTLSDPVFTPAGGTYTSAQIVTLNTASTPAGASLRYTTDGSEPTETSAIYSTGIDVNSNMTIKVKAYKTDWLPSITYTAAYIITGQVTIAEPVFSLPAGTYPNSLNISIVGTLNPSDAVIHYTSNGTDPTEASPVFGSPITIPLNTTMTIKVRAYRAGWVESPIYSATYTTTGQIILPAVMFTPPAGTYTTAQTITLNTATTPSGTTLRYTTDGTEPTEQSAAYLNPIALALNTNTTIKVKAFKTDWIPSPSASATYVITGQITINAPVFSPAAGLYYTPQNVSVNTPNPTDATIRYTTNGTDPTETSPVYSAAVNIPQGTTVLKVKAFKANWTPSIVYSASYQITGQISMTAPVYSPAPGTYAAAQTVSINTLTVPGGATIRYTTDGTVPTVTSPIYTTPINVPLATSVTFRARAFMENWLPSEVAIGTYNITGQVVINSPVFTPPAGIYNTITSVSLNPITVPSGATLYYTTDGSTPDQSSSVYTSAIILGLDTSTTIKVRAFKEFWTPSDVYTAQYNITGRVTLSGDYFTPPAGIYSSAQNVAITAIPYPAGANIHYTTDGSEPTQDSPEYAGPINIPLNTFGFEIRAKAFHLNWLPSQTISAIYNITGQVDLAASPFSPPPGTYTTAQSVTVTAPILPTAAIIRYTLDGSEPTLQSPAYTGAISMPLSTVSTLKIKGFAENWIDSPTLTGVYNITGTIADPVFSRESGIYGESFELAITCATPEVEIRYTTDGTDPGISSALYTEPLQIADMVQDYNVKAKAFKTDWVASGTTSATYSVLLIPINVRAYSYSGYIRILWNSPLPQRTLDGFNLYRRRSGDSGFTKVNTAPINTFDNGFYYYDDYVIQTNETYQYYVTAIYNGVESLPSESTSIEYQSQDLEISPTSHTYPNPAETSCKIKLVLSRNDNVQVSVSVFDFAGKKVKTLIVPTTNTNLIEIPWDLKNNSGTKVGRGTYFARIVASDGVNRIEKTIKIAVK